MFPILPFRFRKVNALTHCFLTHLKDIDFDQGANLLANAGTEGSDVLLSDAARTELKSLFQSASEREKTFRRVIAIQDGVTRWGKRRRIA